MHLNSKLLFDFYALKYFEDNQDILEIEPSGFPSEYVKSVSKNNLKWDTLDIDEKHIGNAIDNIQHIKSNQLYEYPIQDNAYDVIVAGQVIEHISDIWKWLKELKRILKNNGKLIIICPVSWPYHEAPIDSWRIYPDGMKALAKEVGYKIELAEFKSLEQQLVPRNTPTYANVSSFNMNGELSRNSKIKIKLNNFFSIFPFLKSMRFPISVSYDTIAVFVK